MKRLALTQHTVRCPLEDRTASLTVRTDPGGYPSRRHLDVTACSLLPSTSVAPRSQTTSASYTPVFPAGMARNSPCGVWCTSGCAPCWSISLPPLVFGLSRRNTVRMPSAFAAWLRCAARAARALASAPTTRAMEDAQAVTMSPLRKPA